MNHKSFTDTLFDWKNGKIVISEDDKFRFNCTRNHLFSEVPGEEVPCEVCSIDGRSDAYIRGHHAYSRSEFKPETLKLWDEFFSIIKAADAKGNVFFRDFDSYNSWCNFPEEFLVQSEVEDEDFMKQYREFHLNRG